MLPAIPAKYFIALIGLTISTFVFNTSEFMPIALLIDISKSFAMTPSETGIMISVYAWMVALLSLPLMLLASRMELKRLLLVTIGVFAAGQFLAGIATSFPMLMGARIVVACAHSIFWSIVAPIGMKLVTRAHQPFALGIIASGSSIAMILGLPIGRVIGLAAGWRMTFACVAVVSFATLAYLFFLLPKVSGNAPFAVKDVPKLFRNKVLSGIFLLSFLVSSGYYTCYSYIEPFMLQISHFPADWITMLLTVFGFAGLLGSLLFSKLYNAHRYSLLASTIFLLVIALSLFYPLGGDSLQCRTAGRNHPGHHQR